MGNLIEAIERINEAKTEGLDRLVLSNLDLNTEDLKSLIPQIKEIPNLRDVNISDNRLNEVPDEIGALNSITSLDARNNNIQTLHNGVGNLINLETLYLDSNKITDIPASIENLKNLKFLGLYDNELTSLPPQIGALSNLENLNIAINEIRELPQEILNLTSLRELSLQHNAISELPVEISRMTGLTVVNLNENDLDGLPDSIGQLTNLNELILTANHFQELPESLSELPNLRNLELSDNELTNETMNWLNNAFDDEIVTFNMAAHAQLADLMEVLQVLYPDNANAVEENINRLNKGGFSSTRSDNLTARAVVTEFLQKLPLTDPLAARVYNPVAKSMVDMLIDKNTTAEKRDEIVHSMATACGDCETPVKSFLIQKAIGKFKEDITGEEAAILSELIQREAVEEKVLKTLKGELRQNEQIEQVQGLTNSIFLEGAEDYTENKIKISGDRNRLPSKSRYVKFGFTQVSQELSTSFAAMCCKTNETNKLVTNNNGQYILDPKKVRTITEGYLAGLGIVSEREKLVNEFEKQTNSSLEAYDLVMHTDKEEVIPLLKTNEQKDALRDLLNTTEDENIQEVFKEYLDKMQAAIKEVGEKIRSQEPKLAKMTAPLNRNKRDRSSSPDSGAERKKTASTSKKEVDTGKKRSLSPG
jgi:Leucine-rich repeat (LRR) protein